MAQEVLKMKCTVQDYLNNVGWSTITLLIDKFELTRHEVLLALSDMLADQDVRIYAGEIVHV